MDLEPWEKTGIVHFDKKYAYDLKYVIFTLIPIILDYNFVEMLVRVSGVC